MAAHLILVQVIVVRPHAGKHEVRMAFGSHAGLFLFWKIAVWRVGDGV